jgi:hypothetical protein
VKDVLILGSVRIQALMVRGVATLWLVFRALECSGTFVLVVYTNGLTRPISFPHLTGTSRWMRRSVGSFITHNRL